MARDGILVCASSRKRISGLVIFGLTVLAWQGLSSIRNVWTNPLAFDKAIKSTSSSSASRSVSTGNDTGTRRAYNITGPDNHSAEEDTKIPSEAPVPATSTLNTSFPTNLRIAFVGDSVTRYQYLALVYYLHMNRWVQNRDKPNLVNEKTFSSWLHFFNYTTQALGNKEHCDCWRMEQDALRFHENRYYADPQRNNYVQFVFKGGSFPAHGHWDPARIYQPGAITDSTPGSVAWSYQHDAPANFTWKYDWASLIRNHFAKLRPKPQYFVMNAGLWDHDLDNHTVVQDVRDALDENDMIGIYKTTTKRRRDKSTAIAEYEQMACQTLHYCFNLSWTGTIDGRHQYWNPAHFTGLVNQRFNEELLEMISQIQRGNLTSNEMALLRATRGYNKGAIETTITA